MSCFALFEWHAPKRELLATFDTFSQAKEAAERKWGDRITVWVDDKRQTGAAADFLVGDTHYVIEPAAYDLE